MKYGQFRISTLFLFTLLCAVSVAWWVDRTRLASDVKRARQDLSDYVANERERLRSAFDIRIKESLVDNQKLLLLQRARQTIDEINMKLRSTDDRQALELYRSRVNAVLIELE